MWTYLELRQELVAVYCHPGGPLVVVDSAFPVAKRMQKPHCSAFKTKSLRFADLAKRKMAAVGFSFYPIVLEYLLPEPLALDDTLWRARVRPNIPNRRNESRVQTRWLVPGPADHIHETALVNIEQEWLELIERLMENDAPPWLANLEHRRAESRRSPLGHDEPNQVRVKRRPGFRCRHFSRSL